MDRLIDERVVADIIRAAEGDRKFLEELIAKIEQSTATGIREIRDRAGSASAVMHRIKGAAGSIGALAVADRLKEWEMRAKQADFLPGLQDLAELTELADRSFRELRRMILDG